MVRAAEVWRSWRSLPRRLWHSQDRLVRPFVVSSATNTNLAQLDGLRGIAVLMVVLLHAWFISGAPLLSFSLPIIGLNVDISHYLSFGAMGVIVFFVLSGFLLSQPWFKADYAGRPRPALAQYFRRRFLRIAPAYYVCLFLMILLLTPVLIPRELVYSRTGALIIFAHVTFAQYLHPLSASSWSVNGALWSLTMEAIFYLILPWAVILFLGRRSLITVPGALVLTLAWLYVSTHSLGFLVTYIEGASSPPGDAVGARFYLSLQFPAHLLEFALGISLANLYVRNQAGQAKGERPLLICRQTFGSVCFVVGFLIIGATIKIVGKPENGFYYRDASFAFGATLILHGLLFGADLFRQALSFSILRIVGLVAYSAYLWHMPLIYRLNKFASIAALPPNERFEEVAIRLVPLLIAVSVVSFLVVEKPFLLAGRKKPPARPGEAMTVEPAAQG